jgi:uncharacterized protein (DUF779 family)
LPATTAVIGTKRCRDLLRELTRAHGPLSIHVSGNYGMTVVCLSAGELCLGARDVLLGTVAGVPFYMMTSEVDLWRGSMLVLDVAHGAGPGFSLEGPQGLHFTLRKRANSEARAASARPVWDANAILAAGPPPSSIEIEGSTTDD